MGEELDGISLIKIFSNSIHTEENWKRVKRSQAGNGNIGNIEPTGFWVGFIATSSTCAKPLSKTRSCSSLFRFCRNEYIAKSLFFLSLYFLHFSLQNVPLKPYYFSCREMRLGVKKNVSTKCYLPNNSSLNRHNFFSF